MDESQPLIHNEIPETTKQVVYKRRWWLLTLFALSGFVQNIVWNTWGPIAQSAKEVFGWNDGQIGMFPMWGNVAVIATIYIASYLMDEKGLRISVLVCDALVFLGAAVRCITSSPEYATWLIYLGSVLNGIAGTALFAGPPLLSSIWFPSDQRSTATALSSCAANFGFAASFVIGPILVASPKYNTTFESNQSGHSAEGERTAVISNTSQNHSVLLNFEEVRDDIMRLMYYECGLAGIVFVAVLIYFPDKPPTAPSFTASLKRVDYVSALNKIVRNCPLWLITMAYAIPIGVNGCWGAMLNIILNPIGVTQADAGWIGFYSTVTGSVASLLIARFSDIIMKHMKLCLISLYLFGAILFTWFILICSEVLSYSLAQLYVSGILSVMLITSSIPLFFELSCETSYPVAEGITGGFITVINNIFGVLFLLILQIPSIDTSWMNWAMLGSVGAGLFFLIIFPERYARTDLDIAMRTHPNVMIDVPVPDHIENVDVLKTLVNNDIHASTEQIGGNSV